LKYKFFVNNSENTLSKRPVFLRIVKAVLKVFGSNLKKVSSSILRGVEKFFAQNQNLWAIA